MRHLAIAPALLLAATLGCGDRKSSETGGVSDTTTQVVTTPDVPEPSPGVQDFSFDDRRGFAESVRQQLADVDQRISDLASQAKSRGGAVSDRALAKIRTSRRTIDRNLRRVEAATAANWEEIKQGVNRSVDDLNESIEAAQPK